MSKEPIIAGEPETIETAVITKPNYEGEITRIIRGNLSPKAMQSRLEDYHGNDIAGAMENLTTAERKKLYRVCTVDMLADIFEYIDEDDAGAYLDEMDIQKSAKVISELETDTAADVLHAINKEKRALIIELLKPEIRDDIRLIASFDDDEIGRRAKSPSAMASVLPVRPDCALPCAEERLWAEGLFPPPLISPIITKVSAADSMMMKIKIKPSVFFKLFTPKKGAYVCAIILPSCNRAGGRSSAVRGNSTGGAPRRLPRRRRWKD